MDTVNSWDFECPQFVDFAAGLENSGDDVFFDCNDNPSSRFENAITRLKSPGKKNMISGETENKLLDKMSAALEFIKNTPGLKNAMAKKAHHSENVCVANSNNPTIKPGSKIISLFPANKMCRSKSIANINKTQNEKKEFGLRKRSSSLGDLKMNKKQTYPVTPMCLKRTKLKSKAKAKIKTTEEMQLEEIEKLQKQLIQSLRNNEISLKKLKLKPRQYVAGSAQIKSENLKCHKEGEKELKSIVNKMDIAPKQPRRDIWKQNLDAVKHEAAKVDYLVHKRHDKAVAGTSKAHASAKLQNLSVTSKNVLGSNEVNKVEVAPKKQNATKRYGFHAGLLFRDNDKKHTVVKPFSFDFKNMQRKAYIASDKKNDGWISSSVLKIDKGKENIPVSKVQPLIFKKPEDVVLLKPGSPLQPVANVKAAEKHYPIQIRGVPLAEIFAKRN